METGYRCVTCGCGWIDNWAQEKSFICGNRSDGGDYCHGILIPNSQFDLMKNNGAARKELEALDKAYKEILSA